MNSYTSQIFGQSEFVDINNSVDQSIMTKLMKELKLEYTDYSNVDYWNNRYTNCKNKYFEWLQSYSILQPYIFDILKGKFEISDVLIVGCGNSQLPDHLYMDGIKNIQCIDFSDVLIKQKQQSLFPYILMDATQKLEFQNTTFDLIIDKAMLDCIMNGFEFYEKTLKYLSECKRILKQKGVLLILSYGHPDTRIIYLKEFNVKIIEIPKQKIEQIDDIECHYLYICTL